MARLYALQEKASYVMKSSGDEWIDVFGISVGYGVHATLFAGYEGYGMNVSNVCWNISITGGWFHHIHSYTNGTIPIIYAGDTVTIYSHVPFGFGPVTIFMTVTWSGGSWEKQMNGRQCFRYTELGKNRISTATQDSVVFTHIPANGLYWRGRIIAGFPVPVFLRCDMVGVISHIGCNVTGDNISQVEVLINNEFWFTMTSPPYSWGFSPGGYLNIFSHSPTYTTKAYMNDGQIFWDNLTVYRLF